MAGLFRGGFVIAGGNDVTPETMQFLVPLRRTRAERRRKGSRRAAFDAFQRPVGAEFDGEKGDIPLEELAFYVDSDVTKDPADILEREESLAEEVD